MKEEIILLGQKTFWWKVKTAILSPFWLIAAMNGTAKSWTEFKHGNIDHECKYTGKTEFHGGPGGCWFQSCVHHGCNMVIPREKYSEIEKE